MTLQNPDTTAPQRRAAGLDAALRAASHQAIACGSKSFHTASRLFDARTRDSVVMLYAWCRHCDDVVDGQQFGFGQSASDPTLAQQRVQGLIDITERVLRGGLAPSRPFEALAEVVRLHRIPRRFLLEHLSGFGMDAQGRRYDTLADTLDYSYRVAGVVGLMMGMIMGRRDDATLDRAADLGLAFQLSNIARDVVDDHAAGRVYLPAAWLHEAGLAHDTLALAGNRPALAGVARRLVAAAEPYYASAQVGIDALPLRSACAVSAALRIYRDIGLQVAARGAAAWDVRVASSRRHKLLHLCNGVFAAAVLKTGLSPRAAAAAPRERLWMRPRRESAG